MLLSKLIEEYPTINLAGNLEVDITGIEHDSRRIREGDIFVAISGYTHDGHDYIEDAIKKGVRAIVHEKKVDLGEGVASILVEDSVDALAYLTSKYFQHPWTNLNMIGITGTNGKTTTTYIIKHILETAGQKSGIIGTLGVVIDKELIKTPNTTPDSLEIQKSLDQMVKAGIEACVMEVSSHALDMKRVNHMAFDVGIFTNLSKDHLDYHKDMETYFNSKLKLFLETKKLNIINTDDAYGRRIVEQTSDRVKTITYGLRDADIFASDIVYQKSRPSFRLNTPKGSLDILLGIPGEFNIYNSLAAAATCFGLGVGLDDIKAGLESFKGVRGRFEEIETNKDFRVILDFAHTPEGVKEALKTIEKFAEGRIIVIIGAGGNRDKTKRPEMGRIAAQYSDLVIVTSDNPRFEDPEAIANDVLKGVLETDTDYRLIIDRKEAINYAIMNFRPKDTIFITGKGHEETISIMGKEIPFNEREIVLDILKKI